MNTTKSILEWINDQKPTMLQTLRRWCDINSHTFNVDGVNAVRAQIAESFSVFNEKISFPKTHPYERIVHHGELEKLPLADGLYLRKRPEAKHQVICVIHMDTVFSPTHVFQQTEMIDEHTLRGPGVTDAKGGIVVMLNALQAFEQSEHKDNLGWQVYLNTDEEVGSPGSTELLKKYAQDAQIGLVFEPSLPDGQLVSERKGSGNFTLVARGKAAHAGRDFHEGRNAIHALSKCIVELGALTGKREELTCNIGRISGGEANNIVADLAVVHFNVRLLHKSDQFFVKEQIHSIIDRIAKEDEVIIDLHGDFQAPPRVWNKEAEQLFHLIKTSGDEIGCNIKWRPSGGVCDGNRLADAGLIVVDSLGVVGGSLHNDQEYLLVDSLLERTKLTYLLLTKIAQGGLS